MADRFDDGEKSVRVGLDGNRSMVRSLASEEQDERLEKGEADERVCRNVDRSPEERRR